MQKAEERRAQREARIKRIVDEAPPLTPEMADRIAALLRPAPRAGKASGCVNPQSLSHAARKVA